MPTGDRCRGWLVLIVLFIICGVSTWWLFQRRTELAVRTLHGSVIPELQQSGLPPEEKREVIAQLQQVVDQGEAGQLENWQASGIMERLNRSPVLQWGDLAALEGMIGQSDAFTEAEREEATEHLSRLRRAAELRLVSAVDVSEVLATVLHQPTPNERPRVDREATPEAMRDAVQSAKRVADREQIPDQTFQVDLSEIVEEDIRQGKTVGGL